jgi:alpha-methylacyl-CoA racemase
MPAFANLPGEAPGDHRHGLYRTADRRYLSIGGEPKFWQIFVHELGLPHLSGVQSKRGEAAREIKREIQAVVEKRTLAEWEAHFAPMQVCIAPVFRPQDAVHDPHAEARGQLWREGDEWHVGFPARFSATPPLREGSAPRVGEHTDEILTELGHTQQEIAAWRESAVI